MSALFSALSLIPTLLSVAEPVKSGVESYNYKECVVAGCSSQLCVEQGTAIFGGSTCEWKPEYKCYQDVGYCERQPKGGCSWTMTPVLQVCLFQAKEDKQVKNHAPDH